MGEILISATFPNIAEQDLGEFEKRAQEAVAATRDEAGLLRYEWFLSDDRTKCVVRELYSSSEAVLAHLANVGRLLGPLAELGGGLNSEIFGELSPELRKVLAVASPTVYSYFTGR